MRTPVTLLLLLAFLWPTHSLRAQLMFQRSIGGAGGDEVTAVINMADGGNAYVGSSSSHSAGNYDIYVVRLDAVGDTLWTRTCGSTSEDLGMGLAETADGGLVVLGRTTSGQTADLLLVRMDAAGLVLWTKRLEAPSLEVDDSGFVRALPSGGFLVAASTTFGGFGSNLCVLRTDDAGTVLWAESYSGDGTDLTRGLLPTADGGFLLMARTESFGTGMNILLMKCTETGELSWSRMYGDWNNDVPSSLETVTGGYLIGGGTNSNDEGNYYALMMKVSASGSILWSKTYGNGWGQYGYSAHSTTDGGCVLVGSGSWPELGFQLFAVKTTATGGFTWARHYGGPANEDEAAGVPTADGGYLLCGRENSFAGTFTETYLVKTDGSGNSGCNDAVADMDPNTVTLATETVTLFTLEMPVSAVDASLTISSGAVVNTWCETSTGLVAEPRATTLEVYPVPCTTSFRVGGTHQGGTIAILDVTGQVLGVHTTSPGSTLLDAQHLKPGSYLLRCTSGDGSHTLRLLKE